MTGMNDLLDRRPASQDSTEKNARGAGFVTCIFGEEEVQTFSKTGLMKPCHFKKG
jgi:hypothetical protein